MTTTTSRKWERVTYPGVDYWTCDNYSRHWLNRHDHIWMLRESGRWLCDTCYAAQVLPTMEDDYNK